jgi:hypothetical protein
VKGNAARGGLVSINMGHFKAAKAPKQTALKLMFPFAAALNSQTLIFIVSVSRLWRFSDSIVSHETTK